jgi:IPT/TIG domain
MNPHLRLACLFLLAAFFAWAAVPRVTSVEPPFGTNGDELVVNGENLGKATVVKMFLTASGEDHQVEIKDQTADKIRFQIPADLALGKYNLTLQTGGDAPAILEQPIACSVVDEEGKRKMTENRGKQQEVQIIEQTPEGPQPQTKKQ